MRASAIQQLRQTIRQAEVFAIAGGVLANQRNLLHAFGHQALRFGYDRFKSSRAKFSAQLAE